MSALELLHGRILVVLTDLVKRKNHGLRLNAVFIPARLNIRRGNTYSDAGSPDCEFSGSPLWPENSLGTGS